MSSTLSGNTMFNIDAEFIEQLKDDGYDLWTISMWENWLVVLPELPLAIAQIRKAFRGVQLGDGIGLLEANGMDHYMGEVELARLRQLDEKTNWENLDLEQLNRFHSAPSFFDPRGFHFHLPAFLIAELNDNHEYSFTDRIVEKRPESGSWIDLLTPPQADALVNVLSLVKQNPDYYHDSRKIDFAIKRFATLGSNQENA